ncbi:MAG: integrase arm-type DNA-binding domain-containing protein [Sphingomonas sp.]|uniref:tyrosine-type recombinase/integrase n=1 Tax=Sphingomonas sp. TaxID=28214 RepID=UPI0025D2C151|nr:site-specific integrase [Sphingomonas sp.]MBX3565584.1 integrase arm-type DNA-binding domain-containing protein [Sphingomonas sp.]
MRRYRNKLSVKQINSLPPGRHSDGAGLYVMVKPTGTRSWVLINITCGHRREMGLGCVDDVSLAEARERASIARRAFAEGRDPIAERKAEREARRPKPPKPSFGKYADKLIDEIEVGFRNEKHRIQWRSTLATHAKALREKPLDRIDTNDVVAVLRPIWTKIPETASRVRGRIERVLDAARVAGHRSGENPARWKGHLELILPRRRKSMPQHLAALPFNLIADFMRDLGERPATAARALEFTILTAARSGETIGMTWREVDLEQRLWIVPTSRMKAGAEHKVPLSDWACEILEALRPERHDPKALVFPGARGGEMSNMAMAMLLRRMGYDDITVHGFRSAFRDWAGEETDFEHETVEMALAHSVRSKAERAYRRGRALRKRVELMAAWADYCGWLGRSHAHPAHNAVGSQAQANAG